VGMRDARNEMQDLGRESEENELMELVVVY